MKKIIALTLALLMLTMSFVACTGNGETTTEAPETTETPNTPDATDAPAETTVEATEEVTEAPALAYTSSLELLNMIWTAIPEDQRFFVGGGNINNIDTASFDSPAKFVALTDEDYDANLGYPAADAAKLDDVASVFHAMNVNNFTAGVYHFTDSASVDAMVEPIKNNILNRQWICGFPEKLAIVKCPGDYLIVLWGVGEGAVNTFIEKATSTIDGATVAVEHSFAQ